MKNLTLFIASIIFLIAGVIMIALSAGKYFSNQADKEVEENAAFNNNNTTNGLNVTDTTQADTVSTPNTPSTPFTTTTPKKIQNCTAPPKALTFTHHGDYSLAQANSAKAVLASFSNTDNTLGCEFDVQIISTGEIVVFHDSNAYEKTGDDVDIDEATPSDINSMSFEADKDFSTPQPVTMYKDMLNDICNLNPKHPFAVDVKFEVTEQNVHSLFDAIDASSCACTSDHYINFEMDQPLGIKYAQQERPKHRCQPKITFWYESNGDLKTKYWLMRSMTEVKDIMPDTVEFEEILVKDAPELIDIYNQAGFCTSIYGNYKSVLVNYPVTNYRIIDIDGYELDDVPNYKSNKSNYTSESTGLLDATTADTENSLEQQLSNGSTASTTDGAIVTTQTMTTNKDKIIFLIGCILAGKAIIMQIIWICLSCYSHKKSNLKGDIEYSVAKNRPADNSTLKKIVFDKKI
jgi:hypothetical protein